MSVKIDDFERRWAVWLGKGRRHDAIIERRMLWGLATGIATLAVWWLMR